MSEAVCRGSKIKTYLEALADFGKRLVEKAKAH